MNEDDPNYGIIDDDVGAMVVDFPDQLTPQQRIAAHKILFRPTEREEIELSVDPDDLPLL